MVGCVKEGEGEEGGEEKGRTEATEEEKERKNKEENNEELEQQEKEGKLRLAEIREVSRNRNSPKKEEIQILADAPGDKGDFDECDAQRNGGGSEVEDPKRVAVLEW